MKIGLLISSLFLSQTFNGQNIPKKEGDVEIRISGYSYKLNKHSKSVKTNNLEGFPYCVMYFDSTLGILEKIGYGKHHNGDLRLLDFVEQYTYNERGILQNRIRYESDYQKKFYPYWKTKYIYNDQGKLIDETEYDGTTDSILLKTLYEYDSSGNEVKAMYSPTYYYLRTFNKKNKLISTEQVYDNKLRWRNNFTYTDSSRIGSFKTYYNDGKDYEKKEIQLFLNGRLKETEEKYVTQEGLATKEIFYYDKIGILTKIEYYESNDSGIIYNLKSAKEVTIKYAKPLSKLFIDKLNNEIIMN